MTLPILHKDAHHYESMRNTAVIDGLRESVTRLPAIAATALERSCGRSYGLL
jgi:hypothetical protein